MRRRDIDVAMPAMAYLVSKPTQLMRAIASSYVDLEADRPVLHGGMEQPAGATATTRTAMVVGIRVRPSEGVGEGEGEDERPTKNGDVARVFEPRAVSSQHFAAVASAAATTQTTAILAGRLRLSSAPTPSGRQWPATPPASCFTLCFLPRRSVRCTLCLSAATPCIPRVNAGTLSRP